MMGSKVETASSYVLYSWSFKSIFFSIKWKDRLRLNNCVDIIKKIDLVTYNKTLYFLIGIELLEH